jgi:hypothetical protein
MKDKEGFVRLQGMLSRIHLVPKVLCFNWVLCYVGKDFLGGVIIYCKYQPKLQENMKMLGQPMN